MFRLLIVAWTGLSVIAVVLGIIAVLVWNPQASAGQGLSKLFLVLSCAAAGFSLVFIGIAVYWKAPEVQPAFGRGGDRMIGQPSLTQNVFNMPAGTEQLQTVLAELAVGLQRVEILSKTGQQEHTRILDAVKNPEEASDKRHMAPTQQPKVFENGPPRKLGPGPM